MLLQSYLDGLQITILLVTVKDYVIGHAETFSHSKVIEEGRLTKGITHLHHRNICGGNVNRRVVFA